MNNIKSDIYFSAANISKSYNYKDFVFEDINFELYPGDILGIQGINGSGKSTLLKIIGGLLAPTKGSVNLTFQSKQYSGIQISNLCAFVAPYFNLYEEFTAAELIKIFSKMRGLHFTQQEADAYLKILEIFDAKNKVIRTYSSGMKQKMKFLFLYLQNSPIILLDEPYTNLDLSGIDIVDNLIVEFSKKGVVFAVASNDKRELIHCNKFINL